MVVVSINLDLNRNPMGLSVIEQKYLDAWDKILKLSVEHAMLVFSTTDEAMDTHSMQLTR